MKARAEGKRLNARAPPCGAGNASSPPDDLLARTKPNSCC